METKKCNKCRKVKPLSEMDRCRDKNQGNLNTCLVASHARRNIKTSTSERIEMKSTENSANVQQELEKRREKSRRNMSHASRCTLRLSLEFASVASKKSRLTAFIRNIQTVMEIGFMTGSARPANERLTEKNTALSQFQSRQSQAYGI